MKPAFLVMVAIALGSCAPTDSPPSAAVAVLAESIPAFEIPGTRPDGEVMFNHAVAASRFADRSILVTDEGSRSLLLFDSVGRLERSVGRSGQGPGEFGWVSWVGKCAGDSAFVWDPRLARVSVVAPDGAVVRDFRFFQTPAIVSCFPGARLAVFLRPEQMGMVDPDGNSPVMRAHLIVASTTGDSLTDLGLVQLGQTRSLGLHTRTSAAAGRFYVGTGDSAYVDVYDSAGKKAASIEVSGPRRPPTRADYAREIDRQLVGLPAAARAAARTQLLSIPMPDLLPAYQELLGDPTGAVWVVTSPPADSSTVLQGTAPDGRALGILRFPDWFTPVEVGQDFVLGIAETADGEQLIRGYRLRRGSP